MALDATQAGSGSDCYRSRTLGPGAALNIQGSLDFGPPTGVKVRILPTSVGPSEREDLRVHWDAPARSEWQHVTGTFNYEDISGGRWQTHFRIEEENSVRYVHVREVIPIKQP
jgi:hypothetical protein